MRFADLPERALDRIREYKYDRFLEKHEGPFTWKSFLEWETPELLDAEGHAVLLPIAQQQHENVTVLRVIPSVDEQTLTIFLLDTTYSDNPDYFWLDAGRLAICERLPEEEIYLATVYHEVMLVQNP